MNLNLPYGTATINAQMDWGRCLGVLDIAEVPGLMDCSFSVRQAIEDPIGLDKNIFEIVQPGERVAIIVSDSFRHTGANLILPVLLQGLNDTGITDSDIIIVFATGTHRPPNPDEQTEILGSEILDRFADRIFSHDPDDKANLVYVGTTSRGTRVEINRHVHECDRVITTGAVVLHYFGGFGGGRKSILPGISSRETISHNHAMNLDPHNDQLNPDVQIGRLDGNPVAEDMLEGARLAEVDYIVNTVLNRHGEIVKVFAGDLDTAHRAAAEYARGLFAVHIDERADLVIASSGDCRNYVQSHKALFNAYQAVKPEGRIILLAKCEEGAGGDQFVKWLKLGTREAIIAGLREHSEINGQTALSTLQKTKITTLITDMQDQEVALLGAKRSHSLEEAINLVSHDFQAIAEPTYYVMPSAAYTVPFIS